VQAFKPKLAKKNKKSQARTAVSSGAASSVAVDASEESSGLSNLNQSSFLSESTSGSAVSAGTSSSAESSFVRAEEN